LRIFKEFGDHSDGRHIGCLEITRQRVPQPPAVAEPDEAIFQTGPRPCGPETGSATRWGQGVGGAHCRIQSGRQIQTRGGIDWRVLIGWQLVGGRRQT